MVKESCNECELQSTCPKAAHFENYYLDGCSTFKQKEDVKAQKSENVEK